MGVRPRLALYYAMLFGTLGVAVPFWPLWLESRGLGPEGIALVLGAGQWIRVVASPAAGAYVDRSGRRRAVMIALGFLATLGFLAFDRAVGLVAFVLLSAFVNGTLIPLIPLADSLALAREKSHGISYGSTRLWGSVAFIAAAVFAGELVEIESVDMVLWLIVAFVALVTLSAGLLPDPPAPIPKAQARPAIGLLRHRAFVLFLFAAGLAQASHAVYYAFASIHWEAAGHSSTVVGLLWAEGVTAEVFLFIAAARVGARVSPATLIAVGAAGGLVRWGILGATTALPALIVAQLFHALTFGAVHIGAMRYLSANVPDGLEARAQTIYAACVGGIAMGVAVPLSGPLYGAIGGGAFHVAALASAIAFVLALALRLAAPPVAAPLTSAHTAP